MSLSASEKVEVIRMVEESDLPIRRTLGELGISRSSSIVGINAIRKAVRMPFRVIPAPPDGSEQIA